MAVYEPVEEQLGWKVAPPEVHLKLHANAFLMDRLGDHQKKLCRQIGRDLALSRLVNDIVDYFELDNQNEEPLVAAVVGEAGSGKSLFGRCLYENLRKRRDFLRDPD